MSSTQTYQTLNAQLDEVVAKLQDPQVGVDEAVKLYETGIKLVKQLETHIKQAENKIEKLHLQATDSKD